MPKNRSKAWMIAWLLFAAVPLAGAAAAYRDHAVARGLAEPSSAIVECADLRREGSRAVEQGDRGRRQARARDGALAIVLLMAQGPRAVALR